MSPGRTDGAGWTDAGDRPTWRVLLAEARDALAGRGAELSGARGAELSGAPGAEAEARWVLERVSGREGAQLLADLDQVAPTRAVSHCRAMVERRAAGEPLQYVLGRWGFRGLDLLVDGRVLIPRPETEQVVEVVRQELGHLRGAGSGRRRAMVVDLGTGSGAIALSLAAEEPAVEVWATDISPAALAVTRANLAGLGGWAATRVRVAHGTWYRALPQALAGRVDLVVSNPPYIAEPEVPDLPPEVARWEPHQALVAGRSGLEGVEAVLEEAPTWLSRPGAVVVELAPHQGHPARELARAAGFSEVEVRPDLAGRPRVLVARV